MMVQHLLSLDGTPAPDSADALAAPFATRTPGRCRTSSAACATRRPDPAAQRRRLVG